MMSNHPEPVTVWGLCRWAAGYATRRRLALAAVVGAQGWRIGLDLLRPWPMVFLVDYVLRGRPLPPALAAWVQALPAGRDALGLAAWSVGATVLIFLFGWVGGVASNFAGIALGQRLSYDLAGDLFAKLQELSLQFHARRSVGDNLRRVTSDCACVAVIVKDALVPVVSAVVTLVAMFGVLVGIDPVLALLALGVVPWMMLVFGRYSGPMLERSYEQQEVEGRIYQFLEQVFTAIPVVQVFGREADNEARFRGLTEDNLAATLRLTRVQVAFNFLMGLATAMGTAGILWLGARHALAGHLTVGAIIAFLSYLGSLYAPLGAIMYSGSTIQGAAGSARRVLEVLQAETHVKERPNAPTLTRCRGRIQFEGVTFGYDPGRPVLKDISLEVAAGQTIAIVGATGTGKSTLVSLIPRFYDPWNGRVLLDGQDVRELQLRSLRRQVSLVLQEPFLFPMSLAENIAYGTPHATLEQIQAAARAANAHEFIQRLPKGYQTVVGERGATLSGGERQRISIARALLKNAPVLILDEPTSALDAETERSLLGALERLTRDRTTFIIAHRLSTIRQANRIIVLQDGAIAESGTHAELLARAGRYATFYHLQSGAAPAQPTVTPL